MLVTQNTIGTTCGAPSTGFIAQLFLLAVDDLLFLAEPTDGLLCQQILTKTGANLVELAIRPKNATYEEKPITSNEGVGYSVSLQLSYPSVNNNGIILWANANRRRRWVALFKTTTGDNLIAGEVGNGLRINIVRVSQNQSIIGLSFNGLFSHPFWQLPTLDPNLLFSGPTFTSTDFTTDFEF